MKTQFYKVTTMSFNNNGRPWHLGYGETKKEIYALIKKEFGMSPQRSYSHLCKAIREAQSAGEKRVKVWVGMLGMSSATIEILC